MGSLLFRLAIATYLAAACNEVTVVGGDLAADLPDGGTTISSGDGSGDRGGDGTTGPAFSPVPLSCVDGCGKDGLCIETQDGAICAVPCDEGTDCAPGFTCMDLPEGSFCAARDARLCMPCRFDSQCWPPSLGTGFRCEDFGQGKGAFCVIPCSEYLICPAGYVCEDRGKGKSCYPEDGSCECFPLAATLSASTDCYQANPFGKCDGVVACTLEGQTDCTAPKPGGEVCNGKDDDCSGETDEGFLDSNGNGLADCFENAGGQIGDADKDGDPDNQDCAQYDPLIHSGAQEICNGKDDDCDGTTDNGQKDADGDGKADCIDPDDDGDGSLDNLDCEPEDPEIHPGAAEACDGKDQDCDGEIDEDSQDTDSDGKPDCADDDDDGDGVKDDADCEPLDPAVHPGAIEVCDGKDGACDGDPEPENAGGCIPFFKDGDADGYGGSEKKCLCSPAAPFTAENGGDCNDGSAAVKPGAQESCNNVDDDCDGSVDPPGLCETVHKVCIDPGDGGEQPGAVQIVVEKTVNLAMGLKFRDWLNADTANKSGGGAWTVLMTRDTDTTVSAAARCDYANANGAERFVSIHNNSCGGCGGNGTETWIKPGAQGEAQNLAGNVQAQLVAILGLKDRGVKTGDYYQLTHTNMPAILTLPGFVDSAGDVGVINSAGGQSNAGKAMMFGVQQNYGIGAFQP